MDYTSALKSGFEIRFRIRFEKQNARRIVRRAFQAGFFFVGASRCAHEKNHPPQWLVVLGAGLMVTVYALVFVLFPLSFTWTVKL